MKNKVFTIIFGALAAVLLATASVFYFKYDLENKTNKKLKEELSAWENLFEEEVSGLNGLMADKALPCTPQAFRWQCTDI